MNDYDLIILFSGGADSLLMLKLAKMAGKVPHCLMIDYGQKHVEELEFAKAQLDKEDITWQIVKLVDYNVESGLTGNATKGLYDGVSIYNVPARNSIMLAIAAGISESMKLNEIWIGCDMSDYYGQFPDCKQEYIGRMNEVFKIAFSYPIYIHAPLMGLTKETILQILEHQFEITEKNMYSGYGEFS